MQNELLYGVGGLAIGGLAVYFLIKGGIIPSPAPVVARAPAARAIARPRPQVVATANTGYAGKQFLGPVTATSIPTQYSRSGILARPASQKFESPEHADLIRVD